MPGPQHLVQACPKRSPAAKSPSRTGANLSLDSCIVVYAVESIEPLNFSVRAWLADHADEVMAVSPLVSMECRVGVIRSRDVVLSG